MEEADAEKLLETCKQDVADTRDVYRYGVKYRRLKRRAKSSRREFKWALPNGAFATVAQAWATLNDRPPDQTWMSEPPDLRKPVAWIVESQAAV